MFKSCFLKKRNDFDCIKRLCCLSSANNDWSNESVLYSDGMFSGAVGIADVTALINLLLGDD